MTPETSILPLAIAMLQFQMSQNQAPDQLIYEGLKNSQQSSSLSIAEEGVIVSDIRGVGNGGNITINARNTVSVIGNEQSSSGIRADIGEDGTGEAGNIEINARKFVTNNGLISADVLGDGNGGTIEVSATSIELSDSSFISADVLGDGNGGIIEVSATDSIELSDSSFIQANVFEGSTGDSGNLSIETKQLMLDNGSQISATTFGSGNAGAIFIEASESISLSGVGESSRGGIFASALVEDGNGGNINLTTERLTISDGAIITASNFSSLGEENGGAAPGTGEPGNIFITANALNLESEGRIETVTQAETGTGADINLQVADSIFLRGDSFISAEALGNANGGNLTIDTDFIVAFPDGNNDIIASAEQGQGGNIDIIAEAILGIQERELNDSTNDINASSQFSLDGSVNITTPDLNPIEGAIELPRNVVYPGETTAQTCNSDRQQAGNNSLILAGKGGIASSPAAPLDSENLTIDGEVDNSITNLPQPIETSQGKIQPARGVKVTESGKVILTAYRTNNSGKRLPAIKRNCRT